MFTIYLAQRNSDMNEGRGPMVTIAAFDTQAAVKMAAAGEGVMGVGDGEVKALVVCNTFEEYHTGKDEEIRRKALEKLTPREKEVLGLG